MKLKTALKMLFLPMKPLFKKSLTDVTPIGEKDNLHVQNLGKNTILNHLINIHV